MPTTASYLRGAEGVYPAVPRWRAKLELKVLFRKTTNRQFLHMLDAFNSIAERHPTYSADSAMCYLIHRIATVLPCEVQAVVVGYLFGLIVFSSSERSAAHRSTGYDADAMRLLAERHPFTATSDGARYVRRV